MRFVLHLIAIVAFGVAAHAQSVEIVRNQAAGVEVAKPVAWQHLTPEQAVESFRKVEIEDQEIREAIAKSGFAPIMTFIKYPASYQDLNPTFKVSLHTTPQLAGHSASDILAGLMRGLPKMLPDLAVLEGPTETTISGLPAAYSRMNYTLTISGAQYLSTSELWVVPRGDSYFMIGAASRQDEANGTRAELRTILESVRIDPQP